MTWEQKRIQELERNLADLIRLNQHLLNRIADLEERLSKYETPKNSHNSSVPPSKDENRPQRTKSLRESTGKKSGGQEGHKGTTLEMTKTPDKVIDHIPQGCCECGLSLENVPTQEVEKRQVVDIPPIIPQVTEHRLYEKVCSCGRHHLGSFPNGVSTGISYGPGIVSLAAYMHARQYLPLDRMREFFNDVLHVPICEGTLYTAIQRMAEKALPEYEHIRSEIEKSTVVGADETGARINGKKGWFWTWQNKTATYIAPSDNRGTKTIQTNFPDGIKNAVLVHDCWKSHFETETQGHQICIAHLLRELNYLHERYRSPWPRWMQRLLLESIEVKRQMKPEEFTKKYKQRTEIKLKLDKLLESNIKLRNKEIHSFKHRLEKYKPYVFTFLDKENVPADNNGSERAIRNIKVKQKVSGYFKSWKGARAFAILRSVTDTALKNDRNILTSLYQIALS